MFKLDDEFLENVGLAALPETQRGLFLQSTYEELELRVGTALSRGLSDAQMEEFEAIIDRIPDCVIAWIERNAPDFANDPTYQKMEEALAEHTQPTHILCEFAATKWLDTNRPDYQAVVAEEFGKISAEIKSRAADILAGYR